MSLPTLALIIQFLLATGALILARRLSIRFAAAPRLTTLLALAALSAMIAIPLMRVFPAQAITLLGPALASLTEFTAAIIPAAFFFALVTPRLTRPSERRAVYAVLALAAVFTLKSSSWMLRPASHFTANLSSPRSVDGVCLQTTDSTCVPASIVTLLSAHGLSATEHDMALLCYAEPDGGSTDTRAFWALTQHLKDQRRTDLRVHYARLSLETLKANTTPQSPRMVALGWGFFTSHMVCVLTINDSTVTLADPLTGPRNIPIPEFLNSWSGQALWLE